MTQGEISVNSLTTNYFAWALSFFGENRLNLLAEMTNLCYTRKQYLSVTPRRVFKRNYAISIWQKRKNNKVRM